MPKKEKSASQSVAVTSTISSDVRSGNQSDLSPTVSNISSIDQRPAQSLSASTTSQAKRSGRAIGKPLLSNNFVINVT